MPGFGEGGRQCSGNPDASTRSIGREVWHKGQYLGRSELCFGDAAKPSEGCRQDSMPDAKPRGWTGSLAALRSSLPRTDRAFTPFDNPLCLVRPAHRKCCKTGSAAVLLRRALSRGSMCSTNDITNPAKPSAVASHRDNLTPLIYARMSGLQLDILRRRRPTPGRARQARTPGSTSQDSRGRGLIRARDPGHVQQW